MEEVLRNDKLSTDELVNALEFLDLVEVEHDQDAVAEYRRNFDPQGLSTSSLREHSALLVAKSNNKETDKLEK